MSDLIDPMEWVQAWKALSAADQMIALAPVVVFVIYFGLVPLIKAWRCKQ